VEPFTGKNPHIFFIPVTGNSVTLHPIIEGMINMNKTLIAGLSTLMILLCSCAGTAPQTLPEPVPATEALASATAPPPTEALAPAPDPATEPPATGISFAGDVMPIFQATCIKCHGKEQIKAGLDMRTYDTLISGSFKGAVIVPGDAANSFLVQQVVNGKMPKLGQKLTPEQIQIITDWVNAGALNN
jgi:mono/diheme cytochrome c family protein